MWEYKILGFELYYLFYNFFIYGLIGWIYETCLVSIRNKNFINRGFLNGPIIPIYGAGATGIYIVLSQYRTNYIVIFFGSICLATVLEYITSYAMEKLFHAKWWDYSYLKFNIKGRVCLRVSLLWGVLSVIMLEILQPIIDYIIIAVPKRIGECISYVLILIFMTDFILTFISTLQLDKKLEKMQQLRLELSEYIVATKLYETKEDIKTRLENYKLSDMIDNIKTRLEFESKKILDINKSKEGLEFNRRKEDIELKLKDFISKYQNHTDKTRMIQTRLMNAFPNLKSINKESALKDLRDKLHKRKDS